MFHVIDSIPVENLAHKIYNFIQSQTQTLNIQKHTDITDATTVEKARKIYISRNKHENTHTN